MGRRVTVGAMLAVGGAVSIAYVLYFLRGNPFRPDFSVFWTAARLALVEPGKLYDPEYVTQAQSWLVAPERGLRPWAYPPSALLPFLPLGLVSFWPAFLIWCVVSAAAFLAAARRFVTGWGLLIIALSPAFIVAIVSGQTSLLIAAGMICAVGKMQDRPFLSGMALGALAAIKPQALIAAPLLLDRKGLAGFIAGGAALVAGSLVFGVGPWLDWLRALPRFGQIVRELGLGTSTPTALGDVLGLNSRLCWALGASLGVVVAWRARGGDEATRLVGLVAGGLLITPYAMIYDMAGLVPVAVAALFTASRPLDYIKSLPLWGVAGMLTVPAMAVLSVWRPRDDRPALAASTGVGAAIREGAE